MLLRGIEPGTLSLIAKGTDADFYIYLFYAYFRERKPWMLVDYTPEN